MASVSETANSPRVDAIDFWRGIVLIAILCDHIPGNLIEKVTPRNFAFSDSAEAFVFLSGVSVALAHFGKAQRADWRGLVQRCLGRASHIYRVHIGLTCVAVAIASAAYIVCGAPGLIEADGRGFVFHQPLQAALGVVMLTQQLGYFNILPLYVVLLLWSPAVLAMARVSPWLAVGVSIGIYAATRILGVQLPSWPEPGNWFLNPFAWQLIFTLGIVSCVVWRERPIPDSPLLYWGAGAVLALTAFGVTDGFWGLPGVRDSLFTHLDLFKGNLGLGRLMHFVILAYFVAQTSVAVPQKRMIGIELQRVGRYSLPIFALGSILSCVGQAGMQVAVTQLPDFAPEIGLVYTLFGILGLFLFARYIERNKPTGHASISQPLSARLRARSRALFARPGHGG